MEKMVLQTRQFGALDYEESNVILFPEGLIGFEELRRFLLILEQETAPFRWLISIDEPAIGFAVIDPRIIKPEYISEIPVPIEHQDLYTIVTLHKELHNSTMNLKGPILIQQEVREGKQVILNSDRFQVAYPLFTNH